jgi:hypothetical protein
VPAHPGAPEALEARRDGGEDRQADEEEGPAGKDRHDEPDHSLEQAEDGDRDPHGAGPAPYREMEGTPSPGMHVGVHNAFGARSILARKKNARLAAGVERSE